MMKQSNDEYQGQEGRMRVAFSVAGTLRAAGMSLEAWVVDMSINGALVSFLSPGAQEDFPVGSLCEYEIVLGRGPRAVHLHLESRVVRHVDTGLALTFLNVDPLDFEHLENIVKHNTEDREKFFAQRNFG